MQTKVQKSRTSRNPKTSEKVITDEKKKILFKMSQEMFNEINDLYKKKNICRCRYQ